MIIANLQDLVRKITRSPQLVRKSSMLLLLMMLAITTPVLAQERPALRVAVNGLPVGLDPAVDINIGQNGFRVLYSIFDGLIRRDFVDGGLEPGLATSWEWESENVLVLHLRDGVTFHNGERLTSDDVKFSLERLIEADSEFHTARGYLSNISRVETSGRLTVRIVTVEPDPVLEHVLTMQPAYIVPADYYRRVGTAGFNQNPVGTGPYEYSSFVAGTRLELDAYEKYWGGRPPASEVDFIEIPEVASRITALANGEVDIITALPFDQIVTVDRLVDAEVKSVVLSNIHVLRYNTTHPVLRDVRLRQAMNLAIDRQLLSDAFWGGLAEVPRSHQFREFGRYYDSDHPKPRYDPEHARRLVEEAHYNGEVVYLNAHPTYYVNGLNAASAVVEMWRAVGINAEVQVVPGPAELFGRSADDPLAMVNSWSNSMRYPDPAGGLWSLWGPFGPPQASGYWEPAERFNELGHDSMRTRDYQRRYHNYLEMLQIWESEAPGTVLYRPVESYGISETVEWEPYNDFQMDFRQDRLAFR